MTIHRIQRTLVLILFVVPLSLSTDTIAAASTPDVVSKTAGASEVADMETSMKQSAPVKSAKCCAEKKDGSNPTQVLSTAEGLDFPDVQLIDHEGKPVRFFTDLVKGRTVAINTFYTSCTTICPTLSATIAQIQKTLKEKGRDDIQLISISVDPITDTPKRLKAWSETFNLQPGWTMLTGDKRTVDRLLKALQSFAPDAKDHSPMILVGNEPTGVWKQMYGLAPAAQLSKAILDIANSTVEEKSEFSSASIEEVQPSEALTENSSARDYFTDVELVDQNGNRQRFYSDLMRNRVVVISSFFSSCTGVCPILNRNLMKIKEAFSNEMGESLLFLSLTVDPDVDTPARLGEYAESLHAGPGWYFLTGKKESLKFVLSKLGIYVEARESHSNLFLIGNDRTGLWKKAFGLAPFEDVVEIVESVLYDTGEDDPTVADAASVGSTTNQR